MKGFVITMNQSFKNLIYNYLEETPSHFGVFLFGAPGGARF